MSALGSCRIAEDPNGELSAMPRERGNRIFELVTFDIWELLEVLAPIFVRLHKRNFDRQYADR
jgi:hypothetical protein